MSALLRMMSWEFRIQQRQGIFLAALFVVAIWVGVLFFLPQETTRILLPYAIFMDVSVFGFYFMAGMLYLERDDGVLDAIIVTPRPHGWYLVGKVITLSIIALATTVLLTLIIWRGPVNWLTLLVGTSLNAWMLTMVGFILAVRYDSISDFFGPTLLWMIPSQIPALDYLGIWQSWLVYLIPTQPAMLLMAGGFAPLATWQIIYSVAYGLAACLTTTWLAAKTFERFVVRKRGSVR